MKSIKSLVLEVRNIKDPQILVKQFETKYKAAYKQLDEVRDAFRELAEEANRSANETSGVMISDYIDIFRSNSLFGL